jgi:hypothetical protein
MANLVHNEQTKMLANAFNNLAVVSMATGFIGPLISVFLIPPSTTPVMREGENVYFGHLPINVFGAVVLGTFSFVVCAAIAQIILRDLKDELGVCAANNAAVGDVRARFAARQAHIPHNRRPLHSPKL